MSTLSVPPDHARDGEPKRFGSDSLQETIAREGTVRSLPVITVSDAQRLQRDVTYRERAADAMMELLFDVERVRGAGRVYIP